MKTKIYLIILGICSISILSNCKKYDEGGTLGGADKAIAKTLWKVESATDLEDGTDITADFSGEVWEFTDDDEFKENGNLKGTYVFSDDKLDLIITKTDGSVDSYRIMKLTSDAMWLEELGKEEIHFIPN